jgi:hypothetical protein
MWLDGQATLHIVDTRTHFSSAAILKRQTVEGVWYAFLDAWATLYLGYPDTFKLDQGSVLTSPRWKELSYMAGTRLQLSGIESHNLIGSGERYRAPLRRIYTEIRMDYPELDSNLVLRLSIEAMNDTMGPEGLVPSLLVFGVLPRFPATQTSLPNQKDRMEALSAARSEMETITSELRLAEAMHRNVPPAAHWN